MLSLANKTRFRIAHQTSPVQELDFGLGSVGSEEDEAGRGNLVLCPLPMALL